MTLLLRARPKHRQSPHVAVARETSTHACAHADEGELDDLAAEANLPIEQLLAKYKAAGVRNKAQQVVVVFVTSGTTVFNYTIFFGLYVFCCLLSGERCLGRR